MIEIIVNGFKKQFPDKTTLDEVIFALKIEDKVMASAVNMHIVKKENWDKYIIHHNDKVELLEFVGGG